MGAERPKLVVALQGALMRAVGEFGSDERFAPHANRVLAAAAALDYVLMLATGTAGVRIAHEDAERAMHEGIARAVDELLAAAVPVAELRSEAGREFTRDCVRVLQAAFRQEGLDTDDRRFALIALINP